MFIRCCFGGDAGIGRSQSKQPAQGQGQRPTEADTSSPRRGFWLCVVSRGIVSIQLQVPLVRCAFGDESDFAPGGCDV